MNLDELRPCAECGGAIVPVCYRFSVDMLVVSEAARRERYAMSLMLGPALAEVFDSHGARAVKEVRYGSRPLLLCAECAVDVAGELMSMTEKPADADAEESR